MENDFLSPLLVRLDLAHLASVSLLWNCARARRENLEKEKDGVEGEGGNKRRTAGMIGSKKGR